MKFLFTLLTLLAITVPSIAQIDFEPNHLTSKSNGVTSVYPGDLDGDGDMDVVSTSWIDDKIIWNENIGNQNFIQHVIATNVDGAQIVILQDMDNDGDLDIISGSTEDSEISWYQNSGDLNFTKNLISTNIEDIQSIYAVDFDSDGDIDILTASKGDHKIALHENDGSFNFSEQVVSLDEESPENVIAEDVDGDGQLDILASSNFDEFSWYKSNGDGTYTEHIIANKNLASYWTYSISAVDIDQDGDLDVLHTSVGDSSFAWYKNDGAGVFTEQVINNTNTVYIARTFGFDADLDGDIDIVSYSIRSVPIVWFENDGDENFTQHLNVRAKRRQGLGFGGACV